MRVMGQRLRDPIRRLQLLTTLTTTTAKHKPDTYKWNRRAKQSGQTVQGCARSLHKLSLGDLLAISIEDLCKVSFRCPNIFVRNLSSRSAQALYKTSVWRDLCTRSARISTAPHLSRFFKWQVNHLATNRALQHTHTHTQSDEKVTRAVSEISMYPCICIYIYA